MTLWHPAGSVPSRLAVPCCVSSLMRRCSRRQWLCGLGAATAAWLFRPQEAVSRQAAPGPRIHLLDGSREPALQLQLDGRGTLSWFSGQQRRQSTWGKLWQWGTPLDPLTSLAAMVDVSRFMAQQFQRWRTPVDVTVFPGFDASPEALAPPRAGNVLVTFQQGPPAPPLRFHPGDSAYVLLPEGGLIVGDLRAAARGHLGLVSVLGRKLELPWSQVAGVLIAPPGDPLRAAAWEVQVRNHRGPGDRCVLTNGDQLRGTVVALDREQLQIRLASGQVSVPLQRVRLVALDPKLFPSLPKAAPRVAWVGLMDGSILPVSDLLLSGQEVQCRLLGIQPLRFRQRELVWIQPRHQHAPFLSDRQPNRFRHVPLLQATWPLQRDRNVGGGLLRAGGRRWLKGLGMHSLSQATYLLRRPAQRLLAYVAVDDQAGPRGAVVFRVVTFHRTSTGVQKKIAYTSPVIRRGEKPVLVNVPLEDAAAVSLVVQYGPGGDQHDWADWLAPVLVYSDS